MAEVAKFCFPEARVGITKEHSALIKKHTHLIKQYILTMKQINDKEKDLNSLKKKDRLFIYEKRNIEDAQSRANLMAGELDIKEEIGRSLSEKLKNYEKQNKILSEQTQENLLELRRLGCEYDKRVEEVSLFKEIAVLIQINYL